MMSKWRKLLIQQYANLCARHHGWCVTRMSIRFLVILESLNRNIHTFTSCGTYSSTALVRVRLCMRLCSFWVESRQYSAIKSVNACENGQIEVCNRPCQQGVWNASCRAKVHVVFGFPLMYIRTRMKFEISIDMSNLRCSVMHHYSNISHKYFPSSSPWLIVC